MPRGSTGTPSNRIINAKRVEAISCNCHNCFHSKPAVGTIYCTYYDLFSPKRKKCSRYYPVRNIGNVKKTYKGKHKSGKTR